MQRQPLAFTNASFRTKSHETRIVVCINLYMLMFKRDFLSTFQANAFNTTSSFVLLSHTPVMHRERNLGFLSYRGLCNFGYMEDGIIVSRPLSRRDGFKGAEHVHTSYCCHACCPKKLESVVQD